MRLSYRAHGEKGSPMAETIMDVAIGVFEIAIVAAIVYLWIKTM